MFGHYCFQKVNVAASKYTPVDLLPSLVVSLFLVDITCAVGPANQFPFSGLHAVLSTYIDPSLSRISDVRPIQIGRIFRPQSQKETAMTEAKTGDIVRINYTGRLTDGTHFDSSEGREPLQFKLGEGQVIQGLEAHITGMEPGTKSTVTIPCDAAYGPRREEAVQTIDRAKVPSGIDVEVGTKLQARTADGTMLPITVVEVDDDSVKVDANHPLAGQDLIFDVELVEIVKAA